MLVLIAVGIVVSRLRPGRPPARVGFLVFDTITYDPSVHSDQVMFGKYWRQYQRSVQHAVVRASHGSLRRFRRSGASFSDHVRYFLSA